jgi:hypothetical protein
MSKGANVVKNGIEFCLICLYVIHITIIVPLWVKILRGSMLWETLKVSLTL